VLIGILLPALSRAREQAKQVQCMSNLRQVMGAVIQYCSNNKGWLPAVSEKGNEWAHDFLWYQWGSATSNPNTAATPDPPATSTPPFYPGGGGVLFSSRRDINGSALAPYLGLPPGKWKATGITKPAPTALFNINVLICPSDEPYRDRSDGVNITTLNDGPFRYSYTMNRNTSPVCNAFPG
jgi:hypothetical protein